MVTLQGRLLLLVVAVTVLAGLVVVLIGGLVTTGRPGWGTPFGLAVALAVGALAVIVVWLVLDGGRLPG